MKFPLYSIQAMTNDFPPLLREWISPKGLREISITFLLVAQIVTEREKGTGQYFKAKTYKYDSRYCTSALLNCLVSKRVLCYSMVSVLPINSIIWSGLASDIFLGALTQHNCIPCASWRKVISLTQPCVQRLLWNSMISGHIAQIAIVPDLGIYLCSFIF